MIIDCHGHVSAPANSGRTRPGCRIRGAHGRGGVKVSDDEIRPRSTRGRSRRRAISHAENRRRRHAARLAAAVSDHAEREAGEGRALVHRGDPQHHSPADADLPGQVRRRRRPAAGRGRSDRERAARARALRGAARLQDCLLNPDPYENSGVEAPALGDRYWYPLYEKLCELDIPAHIHTAARSRSVALHGAFRQRGDDRDPGAVNSDVFKDFPSLKIVVSHGGGAIPYQLGRFDASSLRGRGAERFRDRCASCSISIRSSTRRLRSSC